jgi:protein phosphatase
MNRISIVTAEFSECGPIRKENEDSIYSNLDERLFVVADGLGGLAEGKHASSSAIDIFANYFSSVSGDHELRMREALEKANRTLFDDSRSRNIRSGTTFTAVYMPGDTVDFIHVGDSALWLLQPNIDSFTILTREDTVERDYLKRGQTVEFSSRYKNVLTQAVGLSRFISPQTGQVQFGTNDILLVCSDGLSGCVTPTEILTLANSSPDVLVLTAKLKKLAIERLPKDNFSAIVIGKEGKR